MRFLKKKRAWLLLIIAALFSLAWSNDGTRALMMTAPNTPNGPPATPALEYDTLEDWNAARFDIIEALQDQVYGQVPLAGNPVKHSHKTLLSKTFNGTARIEEIDIRFRPKLRDETDREYEGEMQLFRMVLIVPLGRDDRVPVIMTQNFCPNHDVVGKDVVAKPRNSDMSCANAGTMSRLIRFFFGRYIVTPPFEDIISRGYAVAVVFPPDWVADSPAAARQKLNEYMPGASTIAAWASQFEAMAVILEEDGRFRDQIAFGHSRYGKSALLAAAVSPNIDGVIAHQSGTGGASLSKDKAGETVAQITQSYPHWFSPNYVEGRLTVDQHHLLALIAPKPLMLGNAKRDVWSDPEGAFRAAQAASEIYGLYGSGGMEQTRLDEFQQFADIAYWIRPGTHGVTEEDWPAFLDFLDAHFGAVSRK